MIEAVIDPLTLPDIAALCLAIDAASVDEWACPRCGNVAPWTTSSGVIERDTRQCIACVIEFPRNPGLNFQIAQLADALEEAGSDLAEVLRLDHYWAAHRPSFMSPNGTVWHYGWQIGYGRCHNIGTVKAMLGSLQSSEHWRWGDWFLFPIRSAAYLALAAAVGAHLRE